MKKAETRGEGRGARKSGVRGEGKRRATAENKERGKSEDEYRVSLR